MNSSKRETYISPRRLDMMCDVYHRTGSIDLLKLTVPDSVSVDFKALQKRIAVAEGDISPEDNFKEEISEVEWWTKENVGSRVKEVSEYITNNPNDPFIVDHASTFIEKKRIGAPDLVNDYGDLLIAVHNANPGKVNEWVEDWGRSKVSQVRSFLRHKAKTDDTYRGISEAL